MTRSYHAAVVTVSDSVAGATREDLSGPTVVRTLEAAGWTIKSTEVLPDDFMTLRERLGALAVDVETDAVFTVGGTGLSPRDRTPEATTSVMERAIPGLAEIMRREGMKKTPLAALSRAVAGVKGKALLINLPGSPEGAEDSLRAILELLPHAIDVVRGEETHGQAPAEPEPVATPIPSPEPSPAEAAEPASAAPDSASDAPE